MASTTRRARRLLALLIISAAGLLPGVPAAEAPTVLITGASRGIGLEFTRQYAARGWQVLATCRTPAAATELQTIAGAHANVHIEQLDVNDHARIDALAKQYRDQPIDLLINNAGISGGFENQVFGNIRYEYFNDVLATNFIAPLKMAEAFIDHIAASEQKKIISISSRPSSIALTTGGQYIDRPSKASLNMVMRTLAKDVADRGVTVGLVAPGLVDTDLTKALVGIPKISPEASVAALIELIDNYTFEMSGSLIQHTGEPIPW